MQIACQVSVALERLSECLNIVDFGLILTRCSEIFVNIKCEIRLQCILSAQQMHIDLLC